VAKLCAMISASYKQGAPRLNRSSSNRLKNNYLDRESLLGLSTSELCQLVESLGEPAFHGRQIYRAIYGRRCFNFEEMTDLSTGLRERLNAVALINLPRPHTTQISVDGTRKYLLELSDGQKIESVFIPEERRNTLCISTQVGCPMECRFCLTALLGFTRNLTVGEIVGQIFLILKDRGTDQASSSEPVNIVLMGMGEPLLNFDNVTKALALMADPQGMGISPHRITLSTVGLVPKITALGKAAVVPNLAISLSATTDEVRDRLMPINKKYPIGTLLQACAQFPLRRSQRITFEYVLIAGVNDSDEDARRLVKLLAPLRSKVNLLALNPGKEGLRPSSPERVKRFQELLSSRGLPVTIRRPRGADIFAACGQLHRAESAFRLIH
jgi:23S rRNA (adenine2503-C2)-methyltransferase